MGSASEEKESCQSVPPSTKMAKQGCGIVQNRELDANLALLEAPALAKLCSETEGGAKIPDNKRIAMLSIGFGAVTASGMFAIASFQRASTVFITSITMLGLLAGAGFVYLVVKAILSAEYDIEL